jgi:hypothetical protein
LFLPKVREKYKEEKENEINSIAFKRPAERTGPLNFWCGGRAARFLRGWAGRLRLNRGKKAFRAADSSVCVIVNIINLN